MAEQLSRVVNEREADGEALLRGGIREPCCHTVPVCVERELFGIERGVATRWNVAMNMKHPGLEIIVAAQPSFPEGPPGVD